MPPQPPLVAATLREFTDRLAERSATPGGGSVAAYLVASGAGLAAMACRFTSGEKFAAVEAAMSARVEELEAIRARALELVDLDSAAYGAVTAAYRLPKASDSEKAARKTAVQAAMRGALEVPAETVDAALRALRLAAQGAPDVNPNLASDALTGALCLAAAAEAALANVRINAASIHDRAWADGRVAAGRALLAEAGPLVARVRAAAEKAFA